MEGAKKEKEKKTMLLVDDQECTLSAMKQLMEWEGYNVTTALNGRAALDIIFQREGTKESISFLVTDMQMPVMNGMKLVEEVQKLERRIPILVISGNFSREMEKRLIQKEVGILDKPFIPDEFVKKINEILTVET